MRWFIPVLFLAACDESVRDAPQEDPTQVLWQYCAEYQHHCPSCPDGHEQVTQDNCSDCGGDACCGCNSPHEVGGMVDDAG